MESTFAGTIIGKYQIEKLIGQGNWSDVYSCEDMETGVKYAVKITSEIKFKKTPKLEELIRAEITILRECNNQNVIKIFDQFSHKNHTFMVMEFCNGGDLGSLLTQETCIPETIAVGYLKQMLNGFHGLHQVRAMHRDFKIENVLLHNKVCKIADLGFGRQLMEFQMATSKLGSNYTMAPEVMRLEPYDFKVDIWSLGVVFYQLLFGDYPFRGRGQIQILEKALMNEIDFTKHDVSEDAQDFIRRCLTVEAEDRINWKQIYHHPLITNSKDPYLGPLSSKINMAQNSKFYNHNQMKQDSKSKFIGKFIRQSNEYMQRSKIYSYEYERSSQMKDSLQNNFYKKKQVQLINKQVSKASDRQIGQDFSFIQKAKMQKQAKMPEKQQFLKQQSFTKKQINCLFEKKPGTGSPSPSPLKSKQSQPKTKSGKQQLQVAKRLEKDIRDNPIQINAKESNKNNIAKKQQKHSPAPRRKIFQLQQIYLVQEKYLTKMNNIMFIVTEVLLKNKRIFKIINNLNQVRHEYYILLIYADVDLKLLDLIQRLKNNQNVFNISPKNFQEFIKQKKQSCLKQMKSQGFQIRAWSLVNETSLSISQKSKINDEFKKKQPQQRSLFLKNQIMTYWNLLGQNLNKMVTYQRQLIRLMYGLQKFAIYNEKNEFNCDYLRKGIYKYDTQMGKKIILSRIVSQDKKKKVKYIQKQPKLFQRSASCQKKTLNTHTMDMKTKQKQTNIFNKPYQLQEYYNERNGNYPALKPFQLSTQNSRYKYSKNFEFQSKTNSTSTDISPIRGNIAKNRRVERDYWKKYGVRQ